MNRVHLISAVGTPLDQREGLHAAGLAEHLERQFAARIDGILVAGTMGLMQLLADRTYQDLVRRSVESWKGRGELLIGVGDASFARTVERIRFVNETAADGVVALAPYFVAFSQAELLDYYRSLADVARAPLFLYDLPQRTRTVLEIPTVLKLAEHPNIRGIKCSGPIDQTRALMRELRGSPFRVIVAQPLMLDSLVVEGIREHLDGAFAILPGLARRIADKVESDGREAVREEMAILKEFLVALEEYGIFPAMTAMLNSRGIPGNFAPRPYRGLSAPEIERLLADRRITAALARSEAS